MTDPSPFFASGHMYIPDGATHFACIPEEDEWGPNDPRVRGYPGDPGPARAFDVFWFRMCRDEYKVAVNVRDENLPQIQKRMHRQRDTVRESGKNILPTAISDLISGYAIDPRLVKRAQPVPECPKCAAELQQAAEEKS